MISVSVEDEIHKKMMRKIIAVEMRNFIARGGRIKRIGQLTADELLRRHQMHANFWGARKEWKKNEARP